MSICYDPNGDPNGTTLSIRKCPKRPILTQGVLNPIDSNQSTAMKQSATIQRNQLSYRRNTIEELFPVLGTINGIRNLTFYYSAIPVTIFDIPWEPYASTQEESYHLAYLYIQSMSHLNIKGLYFPYYVEDNMVYYLVKHTMIYGDKTPVMSKHQYGYYIS